MSNEAHLEQPITPAMQKHILRTVLIKGRYIQTPVDVIGLFGDANPAVILGDLCDREEFHEKRGELLKVDGKLWFYYTVEKCMERTKITISRQKSAFKNLIDLGIIETDQKGVPSKRYISINHSVLFNLLFNKDNITRSADFTDLESSFEKQHDDGADQDFQNSTKLSRSADFADLDRRISPTCSYKRKDLRENPKRTTSHEGKCRDGSATNIVLSALADQEKEPEVHKVPTSDSPPTTDYTARLTKEQKSFHDHLISEIPNLRSKDVCAWFYSRGWTIAQIQSALIVYRQDAARVPISNPAGYLVKAIQSQRIPRTDCFEENKRHAELIKKNRGASWFTVLKDYVRIEFGADSECVPFSLPLPSFVDALGSLMRKAEMLNA